MTDDERIAHLHALGLAHRDRGAWADALAAFNEVLALETSVPVERQRHGDIGMTLHELAWITAQLGDDPAARALYERARDEKQHVPDDAQRWDALSTTLHELGVVEDRLGLDAEAMASFEAALCANEHIDDDARRREADAATLQSMAHVHLDHERWAEAIATLTRVLQKIDIATEPARVARTHYWRAFAHLRLDQLGDAETDVRAGLVVSNAIPEEERNAEHHADLLTALAGLEGSAIETSSS